MKRLNKILAAFTIVELAIVMAMIGILAIIAIPKMFDVAEQSRKKLVVSLTSSLQTTVDLAHAQWQASGQPPYVTIGTEAFYTSVIGYPLNTGQTLVNPMTTTECINLWNALLKNPPLALSTETNADCRLNNTCKFEVSTQIVEETLGQKTLCKFTDKDDNYITYDTKDGTIYSTISSIY